MATARSNPRIQVGSASWLSEERASALQIAEAEVEEFTFSARNEIEWLNEHMAEIFSSNQVNVTEMFKTPGKLRGKTPRTIRKNNPLGGRAALSDIFSSTPRDGPSPFRQMHFEKPVATFQVAEDEPALAQAPVLEEILDVQKSSIQKPPANFLDSGYYGSQMPDATQPTQLNSAIENAFSPRGPTPPSKDDIVGRSLVHDAMGVNEESEERRNMDGSLQSAKNEQTQNLAVGVLQEPTISKSDGELEKATRPVLEAPRMERVDALGSPKELLLERLALVEQPPPKISQPLEEPAPAIEDEHVEDVRSPSEGSSPIRPIVRKSSLNFASLPAREPITTKKSIGNRVSRTSQLDQTRTSYYGRQTDGKSLGNSRQDEHEDMDADELDENGNDHDDHDGDLKISRLHNKTSTQRLQDQISMLGKSQSNVRPSKSIPNNGAVTSQASQTSQVPSTQEAQQPISPLHSPLRSPQRQNRPFIAPGAFPEEEDDSWIGPPTAAPVTEPSVFSPRPPMTKYHPVDVMEGVHGKDSVAGTQLNIPKRGEDPRQRSILRKQPSIPEHTTSTISHIKSVSTSVLRSPKKAGESPGQKTISVSNPNPSTGKDETGSTTSPKSPSRSYRGSPLKAAKDKFSSILKTSRGLFASSAAVSAEAKTSALTPSSNRIGISSVQSFEDALRSQPSYPNLDTHVTNDQQNQRAPNSPGKASVRKTRASTEREERRKEEEAREAKEFKEAHRVAEQLEKARAKVKEEAHIHHLEQERVAVMQKQIMARKEQEKLAKASQVDVPRVVRTSPRKTKAQLEAEGAVAAAASVDELSKDVEMSDASAMPPPARPKSQIGRPTAKRPLKPAKEPLPKAKQPPTVIRVDTGSQRGHQYHPSTSTLAATLQESLAAPTSSSQGTLRNKNSTSSIQSKASTSSFKSAATKALEAAARKKEQDELATQRKREAKLEIERQRAAIKEEEHRKEEQQRRQEAARQREIQREREQAASLAEAKKIASRQAIERRRLEMEKAKQTGAPPPAIRSQPGEDLKSSVMQEKALPPVPLQQVQASRTIHRPQEDHGRSANSVLHNSSKAPPKRPLPQDSDEHHSRPTLPRNPPSYQHNDTHTKRRKTSEDFDNNEDEDIPEPHHPITAPPIRQSSSRPKDMAIKSLFQSGYVNAPQPGNLQRATVISQHKMNQLKPAHPMDMAQVSKAPIPFAPSSSLANSQHKTPARPGVHVSGGKSAGKSAARSSPRYQNGENIELPEINTDSEEDDDGATDDFVPLAWANSPALRTQLVMQETIDPSEVFGQPGVLNMEEVFPKSKDRFHKFRARTSSANWSGQDRLTDDEIRKDLEARDRVRRQGGWTYDSMV